jgi:hypothetical protein
VLLSRAAESIYWIGRHIERAECTARLEATQANLSFDMPPGRELPTGPLLMEGVVPLAGSDDEIVVATEAQVVVALATVSTTPRRSPPHWRQRATTCDPPASASHERRGRRSTVCTFAPTMNPRKRTRQPSATATFSTSSSNRRNSPESFMAP